MKNSILKELMYIKYTSKDGVESFRIGTSNKKAFDYWFTKINGESKSDVKSKLPDKYIPFLELMSIKNNIVSYKTSFKKIIVENVEVLEATKISKVLSKINDKKNQEVFDGVSKFIKNEIENKENINHEDIFYKIEKYFNSSLKNEENEKAKKEFLKNLTQNNEETDIVF